MSLAEWMKLVAESAKDLPDDVYERIATMSMGQTTNTMTNADLAFVYEDFEYSHATPETKTCNTEWRYADNDGRVHPTNCPLVKAIDGLEYEIFPSKTQGGWE